MVSSFAEQARIPVEVHQSQLDTSEVGARRARLVDPLGIVTPIKSKPIPFKNLKFDDKGEMKPLAVVLQAVSPDGFGAGGQFIQGGQPYAYTFKERALLKDIERVHPTMVMFVADCDPSAVPGQYIAKEPETEAAKDEQIMALKAAVGERDAMLASLAKRLDALEAAQPTSGKRSGQ